MNIEFATSFGLATAMFKAPQALTQALGSQPYFSLDGLAYAQDVFSAWDQDRVLPFAKGNSVRDLSQAHQALCLIAAGLGQMTQREHQTQALAARSRLIRSIGLSNSVEHVTRVLINRMLGPGSFDRDSLVVYISLLLNAEEGITQLLAKAAEDEIAAAQIELLSAFNYQMFSSEDIPDLLRLASHKKAIAGAIMNLRKYRPDLFESGFEFADPFGRRGYVFNTAAFLAAQRAFLTMTEGAVGILF